MITLAIGTDHRGFAHTQYLIAAITAEHDKVQWLDCGAFSSDSSDYPVFAHKVCHEVINKEVDGGVLLCGSGIGMAIAANRYPGIYAGLVWSQELARYSKEHDNCNVLVIPADYVSAEQAVAMVRAWLQASFAGGRHQKRLEMIDQL